MLSVTPKALVDRVFGSPFVAWFNWLGPVARHTDGELVVRT